MAKVLKCGDLMPGCNFVVEGKDVAEVMAKGAEHAKTAHGMTSIPPEIAALVSEKGLDLLDAPIVRLGARNVPMPYNDKLELATIPSRDDIMAAIRSVL